MNGERAARWTFGLVAMGIPLALLGIWRLERASGITLHARLSEDGGWQPSVLQASVGVPLPLKIISEDVVHGFAIGRTDMTPIDLVPGEMVEVTLLFTRPGTYTFTCTRWCGPDHWRMRGVIEVEGEGQPLSGPAPALYLSLGIDIDADHPAAVVPASRPSAARGAALGLALPEGSRTRDDFIRRPPAEIWQSLRGSPSSDGLTDLEVWDLVAYLWKSTASDAALVEGRGLYAANCAACHGESGGGEGVMASGSSAHAPGEDSHSSTPADFTDARTMLGAGSALLQGKIVRGGMGTGMPYWGPILTEAQTWALVDYLWTFQFEEEE